jgi:hypothetical protein
MMTHPMHLVSHVAPLAPSEPIPIGQAANGPRMSEAACRDERAVAQRLSASEAQYLVGVIGV